MESATSTGTETIDFADLFSTIATQDGAARNLTMGGQGVRLVAFNGTGGWHKHDTVSETVIVWRGVFDVEYRDRTVRLGAGQCTVITPGEEHRGVSEAGAEVVLFRAV